jgi:outer membrane protein OmpU
MIKLKTIGLTALGTALISTSAFAADMSVSGGASISFDDTNRGKGDRGNGFYMGDSINFAASGEMDNGMSVAVNYEIDGGALDDHKIVIGLPDMGSITFNGGGEVLAMGAMDDVMPNAYEESWDIVAGADASNINGVSGASSFKYTSENYSGLTLNIGYLNGGATVAKSYSDFSLTYAPEAVAGLSVGYAKGDSEETAGTTQDDSTMYVKYATEMGITVGLQRSERDVNAANSDLETDAMGITYLLPGDEISIGYHTSKIKKENDADEQSATGISASYTMGSMTLAGAMNKVDNVAFAAADDLKGYEFTLSFAF